MVLDGAPIENFKLHVDDIYVSYIGTKKCTKVYSIWFIAYQVYSIVAYSMVSL